MSHPLNLAANQHHGFGMLIKRRKFGISIIQQFYKSHNSSAAIRSHGLPSASEIISRSITRNNETRFSHDHSFALNTPSPISSNKKDMAKKRTFAEIIDLTQHESDDENITSEMSVKPPSHVHNEEDTDLPKLKFGPSQRDLLLSETIIRPMNKRNDALRRDTYNAKTIARDVLVASGKHPVMTSLNYHLDILRKKFRHVDNNSDLTTFKWDLVDPDEPMKITDDAINDADDEGGAPKEANSQTVAGR